MKKTLWKRNENNQETWSKERWKQHLLGEAYTESERVEIHAIFSRDEKSTETASRSRSLPQGELTSQMGQESSQEPYEPAKGYSSGLATWTKLSSWEKNKVRQIELKLDLANLI